MLSEDTKELIDWLNINHVDYFHILYSDKSIEDIKVEIEKLISDREEYEDRCNVLLDENVELMRDIDDLDSEVSLLESTIDSLENEICDLEEEIRALDC